MIQTDAYLVGHNIYKIGLLERIEWSWEGGDVAAISNKLYRLGSHSGTLKQEDDVIFAGPLRLRIIDEEWPSGALIVMRDGWRAYIRKITYKIMRKLDFVYRRLILTAVVWNLAEYHEYQILTWRDVYFLKRFVKE